MRTVQCLALACLIGSSMPAFCQTAPAPTDHIKIDVTRAQLQAIGQGVMKLPYETAAPILTELQAQLNAADKAVADAAKPQDQPADAAVESPANKK